VGICQAGALLAAAPAHGPVEPQRIGAALPGHQLIGWSYSVTPDAAGGFVAAWVELEAPSLQRGVVRMQRLDARLAPRGPSVTVGAALGCQGRPAVATWDAEGAAVLWCATPPANKLLLRLFRQGTATGPEVELEAGAASKFEATALSRCGDRLFAVWTARRPAELRVQAFDLEGRRIGEALRLDAAAPPVEANPAVTCDRGRLLITWSDGRDIWVQALAGDGAPAGPRLRVDDARSAARNEPFVARARRGGAVFAWIESQADGIRVVMGRRFRADGTASGPPFRVSSATNPVYYHGMGPRVAAGDDGRLLFVWEGYESGGGARGAYGRWFEADRDLPVEEEHPLAAGEMSPWVAPLPGGGFVAAWSDPNPLDSKGLWARAVNLGPLASAPRAAAEVRCAGRRLGELLHHLRPRSPPGSLAAFERADGNAGGAVRRLTAASGSAAREGPPQTAGEPSAMSWFTVDAAHRIRPERSPAGGEAAVVWDDTPEPTDHAAPQPVAAAAATAALAAGCRPAAASPWDDGRAGWLAEHLRAEGELAPAALAIYRGGGVDTFRADLYPGSAVASHALQPGLTGDGGAGAALPESAGRAVDPPLRDWQHLAAEIRVFCFASGTPAKVRLRLLPACAEGGAGAPCSNLQLRLGLGWDSGRRGTQGPLQAVWTGRAGRAEVWIDLVEPGVDRQAAELAEVCPGGRL
jgi:hypothetical protein